MWQSLRLLFQRSDDLLDFDVRNAENKAVLGDLKSGYLNSFGVFLSSALEDSLRQRFYRAQSLGELKSIVGEKLFADRLQEFDRLNVTLIELYEHQIKNLERHLGAQGRNVASELLPLAKPIYFRKK